jgi:hypothetical protein
MSSIPKPKSRKSELAKPKREMAQRGKIESNAKATGFKSEVDYAIWCAVLGKPSPWLLDTKFEMEPTFEDRFLKSKDRQILLWELFKCWRENQHIPQWVGKALYDILFGMAKGG